MSISLIFFAHIAFFLYLCTLKYKIDSTNITMKSI